jgi:glucose-6-phosphate isomerase
MPGFSQATDLPAWKALAAHHKSLSKTLVLKEYFRREPQRFEKYSHVFKGADGAETLFDFSKNFLDDETLSLLVDLAKQAGLEELRDRMFAGDKINFTEDRAVYHVALRNVSKVKMEVNGKSVVDDVDSVLLHMKEFSNQVRSGEWKGYTGKKIATIVNIGIGGSDLSVIAKD